MGPLTSSLLWFYGRLVFSTRPGGMREAIRRPSGRRAGRAQELASSSSFLQLLVFIFKPSCLQSFPSISVFNFLHCFWLSWKSFSPLHILPIGLRIPPGKSPPSFFLRFSVFCLSSIFLLFFRIAFLYMFGAFDLAWGPQNQAKILKNLSRR